MSREDNLKIYNGLLGEFDHVVLRHVERLMDDAKEIVELMVCPVRSQDPKSEWEIWVGTCTEDANMLDVKMKKSTIQQELSIWYPLMSCDVYKLPRHGAEKLKSAIGKAIASKVSKSSPMTTTIALGYPPLKILAKASSLEELLLKCDLAATEEACTC